MTITGAGFTPGAPVNVFGGTANANSTASGSGAFAVSTSAPILDTTAPATALTTLTATDEADGATATTTVRSANLAVSVTPQSVSHLRTTKVRYRFSGFTPGKRIFAYYIRKKVVARSEFGKATGPCGTLQQKALLYPGGHPAHDKYTVTFESTSRYSRTADPRVTTSLTILRF